MTNTVQVDCLTASWLEGSRKKSQTLNSDPKLCNQWVTLTGLARLDFVKHVMSAQDTSQMLHTRCFWLADVLLRLGSGRLED